MTVIELIIFLMFGLAICVFYYLGIREGRRHGLKWRRNTKFQDIVDFHNTMDVLVGKRPAVPPTDVKALRLNLITEEYLETLHALKADNLEGIADGLVDLCVVTIGTAVSYGIPFDAVWDEIHRSNMAKSDPTTGKAIKREDGKVLKPQGWKPPDVAGVLRRHS